MKLSFRPFPSLLALLILRVAVAPAAAWQTLPPPAAPPPHALPLQFTHTPLGNVARVLSARFSTPITILANATAPITGDFTSLNLRQALSSAAHQAGLVLVALGTDDAAGFSLALPSDPSAHAPPPEAVAAKSSAEIQQDLEQANRRREQLLRQRAALLDAAAKLDD